jgi:uracil DNA glycosylase
MNIIPKIEESWHEVLRDELENSYFKDIEQCLEEDGKA